MAVSDVLYLYGSDTNYGVPPLKRTASQNQDYYAVPLPK
jgi:hypothetical protein